MTFFTLKVLHLLGAAVLFGTGLGIAFFTWAGWRLARRVDSIELLRGILSLTVIRALEVGFDRAFRLWFALGIPAFVAVIALFALMVLRGRFPA